MKMRTAEWIVLAIVLVSFAAGFALRDRMVDPMASHWNVRNEVDGYMPRFWGLFFAPAVLLALFLMFLVIPRIDPLRRNIEMFRRFFESFIIVLFLFLLYLYALTLAWNLGYRFVMVQLLAPGFAALFYLTGVMLERTKRNWFVGIRTPWTLSSDRVWDRTHRRGGRLFKIAGALSLGGMIVPSAALFFILAPILLAAADLVVYSYREYRAESSGGSTPEDRPPVSR